MSLLKYLFENSNMLDISILSADKYLTSDSKLEKFLNNHVTIEAKTDGVKLTVIKVADNGNIDDYIFAYKGNVLYKSEYDYQSDNAVKKESIGSSQFKMVFKHFEKLGKNDILIGTELFIEFLMSKPTLSSNYTKKHGMVLIGYSTSDYTVSFGKLKTTNAGFRTAKRDKYAKILKISTPAVLFDGVLGSQSEFEKGIKDSDLLQVYNVNKTSMQWNSPKVLYDKLKSIFLEVPSKFGGKEEGVVLKFDDVILKWQQSYQLDQDARRLIKAKFKEDNPQDEELYWANVQRKALEIVSNIKISNDLNSSLGELSNIIKRLDIDFSHSKKSKNQIKDDIQLTSKKLLLKQIKGNNGCLVLGKFRILTKAHYQLINDAIKNYDKVAVCLVTGKETEKSRLLRKEMLELAFGDKVELIEHRNGMINGILSKIPFNVNVIFAGSDRVLDYQRQLSRNLGMTVREMKRTNNDISATKVIENISDFDFFKKNTPSQIHGLYDKLLKMYLDDIQEEVTAGDVAGVQSRFPSSNSFKRKFKFNI